jgi:hypothetical protein
MPIYARCCRANHDYPKATIKSALIAMIATTQDAETRDDLISAFVHLADWQEGIGPGRHFQVDLFEGGDSTESARRICAAGPSIMETGDRVIAEMKALIDELKSLGM